MDGISLVKKIAAATDRYNLHSHTEFCDGRAQMEAFAREAEARGFEYYGFSPHSPISIESTCNMLRRNVDTYLDEVARIRDRHARSGVTFLQSMEIDYLNDAEGPAADFFRKLPLDYRIGSVHFIPTRDGRYVDIDGSHDSFALKLKRYFDNDLRYVVETFYSQSVRMVAAGGLDIIGHFDKIGDNASFVSPGIEDEKWYEALVSDLIEAIVASGVCVEVNTKIFERSARFFPLERRWKQLAGRGVTIVVNSDAHVPALIDSGRAEAFRRLADS